MATLAIYQHQQVIRRQAPEGGRAHQCRFVVNAVPLDIVRRGQIAQDIVHIDSGLGAQIIRIQNVHGGGRFFHRARCMPRSDDHYFFKDVDVGGVGPSLAHSIFLRGRRFRGRLRFFSLLGPSRLPDEERTGKNETQASRPKWAHQAGGMMPSLHNNQASRLRICKEFPF